MIKKYYSKIVELGISDDLLETNKRQVRSTNIATISSIFFLISWIPFAFFFQDTPVPNIVNFFGILFLLPVFYLNKINKYFVAAIWFVLTAYIYIILNLLLYGYESGVPLIITILIPIPFLIIPYQRRILSIGFSLLFCISWIFIVLFKSYFVPLLREANFEFALQTNVAFTSLLLLILFYNFSATINRAEKSLQIEREKSDTLLHNILPHFIAKRLKDKQDIIADGIPSASVLFADLVGFTQLSGQLNPQQLVNQLNEIFTLFDLLTEKYKLEKIKTIGDAYMIAGGLRASDDDHLTRMADLALEMLAIINSRNKISENKINIRIGIHAGPVVAGVIGFKKFAYDIWGDTVNIASRMESHGQPGRIHVSEKVKETLGGKYNFASRGEIEIKGKGLVKTYFLNAEKHN